MTMRRQLRLIIATACSFQGIAWIAGYIQGDFTITIYGWFIGLAISLVVRDEKLRMPHRHKNFDTSKWLFLNYSSLTIISLQLCIPDWPMYNRDHVTWLEEIGQSNRSSATPVAAVDSKPKHSKKN